MYSNLTNLKTIIDRLLKNPNLTNLSYEDALTCAVDVLGLLNHDALLMVKPPLNISFTNYKVKLPVDLVNIITIRRLNYKKNNYVPITASTDISITAYNNNPEQYKYDLLQDSYSIRNGYIFFTAESGDIELIYTGLPFDENGDLLIPDNISIIKAIENYIKLQYYTPLWEMGKIPDKVFQKTEQEYLWYVGQAESSTKAMNADEREALKNSVLRTVRNTDDYKTFFRTLGQPEYTKTHKS